MTPLKKIDIKKISNILVFSITLIPLILFLFVVWNRISLPLVFEWGESAGVNQINRILSGAALYIPPTLKFTPLVYTPLYYFLAAGVSALFGNILLSARVISLIATIFSVALIFLIVYRETGNPLVSWFSGMSYLACFALSDGFYDLARVDSLFVLFGLMTFFVIKSAKMPVTYLWAGLLLAVGFFIKQSFLIIFLPIMTFALIKKWKISWPAIGSGILGLVIPVILANWRSDHWFTYYILELPREHRYSFISAVNFWVGDSLGPLGILFGFSLLYILAFKINLVSSQVVTSDSGQDSEKRTIYTPGENWFWYVLFFTGSAAAAWITRSTNGGGPNNGMMLYAALSIVFGLGAGIALKSRWVTGGRWQYSFVLGVIAIQFIGLIYNPFNYLPTAQEIHSNERVINKIRSSEKPIFIPYRSHLNGIYGDAPQIHIVNLFELTGYFMGNVKEEGYKLVDEIRSNICRQEYSLIILDQPVPWFDSQLEQAYYLDLDTKNLDQGQSQLLGWQLGFQRTYIPRHAYNRESCLASISMGQ